MPSLNDLNQISRLDTDLIRFRVFQRRDVLPRGVRKTCRTDAEPEQGDECFAMGFHKPREWLYSALRETQPLAYRALIQSSDLYLMLSQPFTQPERWGNPTWYIEAAGRLIGLRLQQSVPLCSSMERGVLHHGHYLQARPSLGHELALAYCSLLGGMEIPRDVPGDLGAFGLPRGVIDWSQAYFCILTGKYGVRTFVEDEEAAQVARSELGVLYEMFDFLLEEREEGSGLTPGLRCFLDTRSSDSDKGACDFILAQTPNDEAMIKRDIRGDPLIYRVKNHDWDHIEVLRDPARAVDAYVAHTLSVSDHRFDFDPYCDRP